MDANDKYACAELIQAWGLYRDQGKWPQLLATFVPEGEIAVSWFSGSFREFVAHCRQSFEAGQRSKHQGTSNNTSFRRVLPQLSERLQRSCEGEFPIGDRFDVWRATARSFCTTPHGLHP